MAGSDEGHSDAPHAAGSAGTPSDPPELVEAIRAEDWIRVGEIVEAEWQSPLVDHMPTVIWMYRVLPLDVTENHPLLKAGRDLLILGLTTGKVPEVPGPIDAAVLGQSSAALQILTAATASIAVLGLAGSHRAACALVDQAVAIATEAGVGGARTCSIH